MSKNTQLTAETTRQLPFAEFVALMGLLTALVALSIDAMLPALPAIGADLGVQGENDSQLIISFFLLGLGVGQLLFGPLSDSVGRKPAIYAGVTLFLAGCFLSIYAPDFRWMLAGRVLQGFGIAGPRSVSTALIRDRFKGDAMARVMSFIMAVFILVPIIAPTFGQGILLWANWQAVFGLFVVLAVLVSIWFAIRQPETLAPERRIPFRPARIAAGFRTVVTNRVTLGYTIASGFITGGFIGYLNSAQQIFQDTYGVGTLFPLYFGALAIGSGIASVVNARLVMRYSMGPLTVLGTRTITGISAIFVVVAWLMAGIPPFWLTMLYLTVLFFAVGIVFGNMNSLAMEPMGRVAGVGAAVVGSLATLMSAPLGTIIGQAYDGTVIPLAFGFAFFGALTLLVMRWAEAGRKDSETA